jgi:peroxiredoxin Q/BCP
MPDRTSDDAPSYERPSNDDTGSDSDNDNRSSASDDSEEDEGSSDDEEEESSPFVKHQTRLKAGVQAPWFEGKDQFGRTLNRDSFPGQSIVLYFYPKDDTEGCTAESCSLRDGRFHLRDKNYVIVGVSADNEHSHALFADKYGLPFPLLADTDMNIIRAYDVWGQKMMAGTIYDGIVRTTFLIDPDGFIDQVIYDVDTKNHAQQILDLTL